VEVPEKSKISFSPVLVMVHSSGMGKALSDGLFPELE
jgi:hypothetical protein